MLKPAEILQELAYPLRDAAALMSLGFLFLLLEFAIYGGVLGLFLALLDFAGPVSLLNENSRSALKRARDRTARR